MPKTKSFVHIEETLRKSRELVAKVVEQNEQWPGAGAFEEDIENSGGLLKDVQTGLGDVADGVAIYLSKSADADPKSANDIFDQAYRLLSLMYQDIKMARIALERGQSQTRSIEDLKANLKKFTRLCKGTRQYLLNS